MAATPITPLEPGAEMFMRARTMSLLPPVRSDKPRPVSEATEIFDTDVDDDESEFEEDSPPYSFQSNQSRRSQTTISTYDEVQTPRSTRRPPWPLATAETRSVEGPRGPHLFRQSISSSEFQYEYALQMSPVLPKELPPRIETAFRERQATATVTPPEHRPFGTLPESYNLDSDEVRLWSSSQVASWMYQLGFEETIVEKFEHHDITGAVLLDLQFEDLKELEIPSFGKRHRLWSEIGNLREYDGAPASPSRTPFQDVSRPCTRNTRSESKSRGRDRGRGRSKARNDSCTPDRNASEDACPGATTPGGHHRRRGRRNASRDPLGDVITPAESVSIVAIEQLLPKPHKCSKGERCAKYKKQQKQLQRLHDEHGFPISPDKGGHIFVAGDPGNAGTAGPVVDNVRRQEIEYRPTSDAIPSVVASSDLLGPGQTPRFAPLHADTLAAVELRDPQDNVKQFLDFQHVNPPAMFDTPPTPVDDTYRHQRHQSVPAHPQYWQPPSPDSDEPLPLFPPMQSSAPTASPHLNANLSSLPKLAIPRSASAAGAIPHQPPTQPRVPPQYAASHTLRPAGPDISTFSPCRSATVSPGAMDPAAVYRLGTPASEMDAPLTAVPDDPLSRDTSQSVPPNMQYRDPVNRTSSRAPHWQRPSFAMPALNEGQVFSPVDDDASDVSTLFQEDKSALDVHVIDESEGATYTATVVPTFEAPPTKPVTTASGRGKLIKRSASKKAAARSSTGGITLAQEASSALAAQPHKYAYSGVNHHGWMKKRHTKLLRHEWREQHFRLTGTQLAMHADELPQSTALDTIDVDHYAVACSQIASSKLAAKLKALKLSSEKDKAPGNGTEAAAFSFQLVPAKEDGSGEKKLIASGKTHHFAVKNRDERIDWMRELMLAKALKAKGDGYEVQVNGSVV